MASANGVGSVRRVCNSTDSGMRPSGIARAIRSALALTTVALAISGSGSAFAAVGVCAPAAPPPASTVDCEGTFDTVNGNVPIAYSVEDLTVVLGASDPTTSVTTTGIDAVALTGTTGGEALLNYTSITATDAYAINVSTISGDISVTTSGDVTAYGVGSYSTTAINADSYSGNVAIDNQTGAAVTASAYYGSATGIQAYSQLGDVTVVNDGSVSVISGSGSTYGIYAASDDGVVRVTNTGDITAYGVGTAYGMYAQSYANAYVDNQGSVAATATGLGSNSYGVFIYTCDCAALDANVDNSGSITAATFGDNGNAYGVYAYAYGYGNVNVDNSGSILVDAYGANAAATGIYVTLTDGTATINSAGSITVSATANVYGIDVVVDGAGSASVSNGGSIDVTSAYGAAQGVLATSNGAGDVYVGNGGSISVVAYQYAYGIHAYADYTGAVSVDNAGSVAVVSYAGPATGIMASSNGSETAVDSSGSVTVTTYAGTSPAIGINAYAYSNASVINDGAIVVDAQGAGSYATGIQVSTYLGDVTLASSGSIAVTATYDAHGIDAVVNDGNIYVSTGGTIGASSSVGDAYGIQAGAYGTGNIAIDNGADITANAYYGTATGIHAQSYTGDISVTGSGGISAVAPSGNTYGIYVQSDDGDVNVNVAGDIVAYGYGAAYGIYVQSYGDIQVASAGSITATSTGGYNNATGIYVYTCDCDVLGVAVDNTGSTTATAYGDGSDARGIHIYAYGYYDTTVNNDGDIVANALGANGEATGVYVHATDGLVAIDSAGTITVYATGNAYGVNASVKGNGSIAVGNGGAIDVYAINGNAYGVQAYTAVGDIAVTNDGSITTVGYAFSAGISTLAYGDTSITGSGDIYANSTGDGSKAYGIYALSDYSYGDIYVNLSGGSITVYAAGVYSNATGILANGWYGDATVISAADITVDGYYASGIFAASNTGDAYADNSGDITLNGGYNALGIAANGASATVMNSGDITAIGGTEAWGIIADSGFYGSSTINNSGNVIAAADLYATGLMAHSGGTGVYISNSGSVSATAYTGYAWGVIASPLGLGGVIVVDNSGSVSATGYLGAYGIIAYGNYDVSVAGGGSVDATSAAGTAIGIYASTKYANNANVLVDAGSVTVSAYADATGIHAYVYGDGNATVYSGALDVYSATGIATGVEVSVNGNGDVYASLSGSSTVSGYLDATGVEAIAYGSGNATATNSGAMSVSSAYALAQGMYVQAQGGGDASATNSGAIDVSSQHGLGTGIYAASTLAYATVDNAGSVDVAAYYSALGIGVSGMYGATVYNDGSVSATSYYYDATGILAVSQFGDVLVDSSGGIDVSGYSGATGIYAQTSGALDVSLGGSVTASASGDYYAAATGVDLTGYDVHFSGAGAVVANAATAAGAGAAYATGVHIDGTYVSGYTGAGSSISAYADGFYATAVGLDVRGSYGLTLDLAGDIQAVATGSYTWATGVQASSYVDILVYSSADISAEATGSGYASATAVSISSLAGDIFFYNGGNITATGTDSAVAVQLYGIGNTTFVNQGTISAYADGYGGIAFLSGDADDSILNYGIITGAIVTGVGDDTLEIASGATWNAFGDSDFGNGDDAIINHGTISMFDAVINLGPPGSSGNSFANYGTITVSGAYNIIDMEGGSAALAMNAALSAAAVAVSSSNPLAFYNYGLIDLRDGAPDDVLTIVGDFAGDGTIAVDVSGLNETADLLYIDGSVVNGSANSIDVDLLDLPADGFAEVPVVEVSGDSVASSFVLGSVNYTPNPFLIAGISLVSNINSTNSSPDMFSLRVSMSTSDTGAIAAVLPAGVQLLMNDVVGSWHRRVEGLDAPEDGKFSLWARLYENKGKVDPEFRSDSLVGGSFAFEQKNTGGEAGFDFAPNGRFNFGLILGKANANQDLRLGLGTDRIEGTVAGGYGTYRLPRGFYFDLSHRRLKFDAVIDTPQGALLASGEARTSNAESGYKFNYRGFEIEGQLQVTHTKLVSLDSLSFGPATSTSASTLAQAADPEPIKLENDADISSVSRLGVDLRKKFQTKPGTLWELHATLNRVRESGGRNRFHLTDSLGGETDIGGDSSLVDVGFTARSGLLLFYGALTWQDGGALQDFFGAQFGAKYTW